MITVFWLGVGIESSATENNVTLNQSFVDESTGLRFDYKPDPSLEKSPPTCLGEKSKSKDGDVISNKGTIKEFLGPDLQSISVNWVAPFETQLRFQLAVSEISDALLKSPKRLYSYEPWDNSVKPDFLGTLNFKNGKTGKIYLSAGYLCVAVGGKFQWMRFTDSSDLNLVEDSGVLRFVAGNGYFIENGQSRIYLQVAEQKPLIRQLESLLGKRVRVQGELRKVPSNVGMIFPKLANYFRYGFTLEEAR